MQNKKQEAITPRYATLMYDVRAQLDISWTEYVYLDMVYHLSHDGWCYKSVENSARDLGLTTRAVFIIRNRLIELKLLQRNMRGHVRTSTVYNQYVTRLSTDSDGGGVKNIHLGVKKVHPNGEKSSPKNNNRTTVENKRSAQMRASTGLESARAIAERIRQRRVTA